MRGKRRTPPPADAVFIAGGNKPRLGWPMVHEEATEAFYEVAKLLCPKRLVEDHYVRFSLTPLPVIPECGTIYPRYGSTLHEISPAKRAALNNLFNSVQAAIETAHKAGVEEGRNLLMGLAKGTLTADQAHGLAPIATEEES